MQEADIDLNLSPISNKSATVYGKVTDGAKPIPNATVKLFDNKGNTVATTFTAYDGEFAFYDVVDGKYTVISTADGYLPASPMTVTITGGSIAK